MLLVSEPGVDTPIPDHFRVDRENMLSHGLLLNGKDYPARGLWRSFLRDLGELSVVANEAGDDDGDDGHEGEEDKEGGEPGDRKTNSVDNLLAHSTLKLNDNP